MASPLYRHGKLILQDWGIRYPVGHTVGNRLARSEDAVLHSITLNRFNDAITMDSSFHSIPMWKKSIVDIARKIEEPFLMVDRWGNDCFIQDYSKVRLESILGLAQSLSEQILETTQEDNPEHSLIREFAEETIYLIGVKREKDRAYRIKWNALQLSQMILVIPRKR